MREDDVRLLAEGLVRRTSFDTPAAAAAEAERIVAKLETVRDGRAWMPVTRVNGLAELVLYALTDWLVLATERPDAVAQRDVLDVSEVDRVLSTYSGRQCSVRLVQGDVLVDVEEGRTRR